MAKRLAVHFEDEIRSLWRRAPLSGATVKAVAPSLTSQLSLRDSGDEALESLRALTASGGRYLSALHAVLFENPDSNIEDRLVAFAKHYGKESRSVRRWAETGAAMLGEQLAARTIVPHWCEVRVEGDAKKFVISVMPPVLIDMPYMKPGKYDTETVDDLSEFKIDVYEGEPIVFTEFHSITKSGSTGFDEIRLTCIDEDFKSLDLEWVGSLDVHFDAVVDGLETRTVITAHSFSLTVDARPSRRLLK